MMRTLSRFAAAAVVVVVVALPSLHAQTPVEKVHLVVTGGPNAGTYDAASVRGGCSAGLTGPGSFGNQLSQPKEKDPKKFNSLQLIVPNAKAAAAGTHDFYAMIGFGSIMNRSAEYKLDPAKKSGSGTVSIVDKGTTAQVTIDGTTAAGVKLHATIDCLTVTRGQ